MSHELEQGEADTEKSWEEESYLRTWKLEMAKKKTISIKTQNSIKWQNAPSMLLLASLVVFSSSSRQYRGSSWSLQHLCGATYYLLIDVGSTKNVPEYFQSDILVGNDSAEWNPMHSSKYDSYYFLLIRICHRLGWMSDLPVCCCSHLHHISPCEYLLYCLFLFRYRHVVLVYVSFWFLF